MEHTKSYSVTNGNSIYTRKERIFTRVSDSYRTSGKQQIENKEESSNDFSHEVVKPQINNLDLDEEEDDDEFFDDFFDN